MHFVHRKYPLTRDVAQLRPPHPSEGVGGKLPTIDCPVEEFSKVLADLACRSHSALRYNVVEQFMGLGPRDSVNDAASPGR